jgi:hypothetical protein
LLQKRAKRETVYMVEQNRAFGYIEKTNDTQLEKRSEYILQTQNEMLQLMSRGEPLQRY